LTITYISPVLIGKPFFFYSCVTFGSHRSLVLLFYNNVFAKTFHSLILCFSPVFTMSMNEMRIHFRAKTIQTVNAY